MQGAKNEKRRPKRIDLGCVKMPGDSTPTRRMAQVALRFGVSIVPSPRRILDPVKCEVASGRIVCFLGPSGSGKSTALGQIGQSLPGGMSVDRIRWPATRSVIDAIGANRPLKECVELLGACGLGESPLWVRRSSELSDGQRFRARLARAVAMHLNATVAAPLICDEFCTGLHRRLAKAIAYNLRKLVTRHGLSLVVATSQEDIVNDLQPDTTFQLQKGRAVRVDRTPATRPISFSRRLVIERGSKRDYDEFAAMHYRATDELGFVDKVFVMRDGRGGELVGIVVYSHSPLELALRNEATNRRFTRNPRRLNREMRILRRLVVHPDIRGCGLGHRLVRRTLPLVGTRFVECLAAMGEFNPVFEKAGMTRVGTCQIPETRRRVLAELEAIDVDPLDRSFVMQVSRRPRVRQLVSKLVYEWYQATTAGGERRVARQSPEFLAQTFRGLIGSRPVYFLWERPVKRRRASAKNKKIATRKRSRTRV